MGSSLQEKQHSQSHGPINCPHILMDFILQFFFLYFLIVKRLMHLQDLNGKLLGVVSPVPQHKLQSLSHQQVKGSLAWCGSCISRSWSRFEWKLWSLEPVAGQSQEDLP